jgi:hypothetical protein
VIYLTAWNMGNFKFAEAQQAKIVNNYIRTKESYIRPKRLFGITRRTTDTQIQ